VYKFLAHKPGYEDARLMFDTRLAEKANLPVHEVILYMYRDTTSPVEAPIPVVRTPEIPEPGYVIRTPGQQGNIIELIPSPVIEAPPKVGDKLTFFNIYFEQSKADVLPTSKRALDDLYHILTTYTDISIRIEGHTDNVGNELDLMQLSWERAQAVKAALVKQGINPIRIGTVGYGDTKPISDNRTEEGRIKNRRVEIQVVE
jgi:outer membrane protein OmpA-like peptidoglycan-associated protein